MREGKPLYTASRLRGIDARTVKAHLGRYIRKRHKRWHARRADRIERGLIVYERGNIVSIVVNDSETASIIGQYLNDVKKVLAAGDVSILKPYKKLIIRDAKRKKHKLETRLNRLKLIELKREEIEFTDVYDY
jgi:hypothetical protein